MERRARFGSGASPVGERSANGVRSRGGRVVAAHHRSGNRDAAARLLANGSHGSPDRAASSASWISCCSDLSSSCPHPCSHCHLCAARNRRSDLSSHPPSRGDLWSAMSVAAALSAAARTVKPKPAGDWAGSLQPQGQRRRSRMDRWPFQLTSRQAWPEPGRRPRLARGPPGAGNFARRSLLYGPPPSQPSGPAGWSRHSREPRRRALGRSPLAPPSFGPCFGRHDLASSSQ